MNLIPNLYGISEPLYDECYFATVVGQNKHLLQRTREHLKGGAIRLLCSLTFSMAPFTLYINSYIAHPICTDFHEDQLVSVKSCSSLAVIS